MKQSFVLGLDRRVAFARGSAEAIQVGDLDVSPAVADEIGLLQRVGHQRYAVAARADHLRHRFLRQNELVAAGQVASVQQTSRQPGFDRVRGVAPGGLLDLRINGQTVPDQHRPQRRTLIGGGPEAIEIKRRGDAGHQHHRAVQRGGVAEGGERTEDAVAADQRDLNVLSLGEFYDQGDDPFMRQVGALERFVDFNQHGFLDEIDGSQMRPDRFEIVSGQRRQKSIG